MSEMIYRCAPPRINQLVLVVAWCQRECSRRVNLRLVYKGQWGRLDWTITKIILAGDFQGIILDLASCNIKNSTDHFYKTVNCEENNSLEQWVEEEKKNANTKHVPCRLSYEWRRMQIDR